MRQSKLLAHIEREVVKKKLRLFRVADLDCLKKSKSFLSKHCKGNPEGHTVYFVKIKVGLYKLDGNGKNHLRG